MNLIITILKWICIGQAGILALNLAYVVLFSLMQRVLLRKVSDTRILEQRYSAIYGYDLQKLFGSICDGFRKSMVFTLLVNVLFFFLGSQNEWPLLAALVEFFAMLCIVVMLGSLFFEFMLTILKPSQLTVNVASIKQPLHKLYRAMIVLGVLFAFVNWFITLT